MAKALTEHLDALIPSRPALSKSVIPTIIESFSIISTILRAAQQVSAVGSANAFGDEQLNVDVLAERAIRTAIAKCPAIKTASSEEDPLERRIHEDTRGLFETQREVAEEVTEAYALAFDPLDGSSIIVPNWTVGTIVGIWDGPTALHQSPERKQIAAVLGVYGPRTSAIVAIRIPGGSATCFEVGVANDTDPETCAVLRPEISLQRPPFKTRYFSPANLRAAADDEQYMKLVNHYIQQKYTLRYSGGMVPDIVHTLVKGHGIFISPVTQKSKAKLRRAFELAPIALVVECAGGAAIDPESGGRVLEKTIEDSDEKGGMVCGTAEEVDFVKNLLSK
ncbi:MAG: hypothetical protein Q9227_004349 [Pyrenula ochraceoflavens]